MKKILILLTALSTLAYAQDEPGTVTVTGNRVSLRAAPELTGVLLGRTMKGDTLVLKDNSNPEWVGVVPPETVDLWVSSEYVVDGKVVPEKLNVRSGPSLNHGVVGVVTNGQELTVRNQVADWVCVAPTAETTAWISRKYVDVVLPEMPEPVEPVEAVVEIEETAPVEKVTAGPTVEEVLAAAVETPAAAAGQKLKADPEKEQGVEESFTGILQPKDSLLYQLVDLSVEEITVCYVRGNQDQMAAFAHLPLKLTGKAYWAEGMELPVVVPEKIQVIAPE